MEWPRKLRIGGSGKLLNLESEAKLLEKARTFFKIRKRCERAELLRFFFLKAEEEALGGNKCSRAAVWGKKGPGKSELSLRET